MRHRFRTPLLIKVHPQPFKVSVSVSREVPLQRFAMVDPFHAAQHLFTHDEVREHVYTIVVTGLSHGQFSGDHTA